MDLWIIGSKKSLQIKTNGLSLRAGSLEHLTKIVNLNITLSGLSERAGSLEHCNKIDKIQNISSCPS